MPAKKVLQVNYQDELLGLIDSLKNSVQALEEAKMEFDNKNEEVIERDKKLALKSGDLNRREEQIKIKEAEFGKRESEIREAVRRIDTVAEAKRKIEEANIKDGQANELMKKAELKLAEAFEMQKEITVKELALNKERGEYKQRVREEIVNNFLKK